MLQQLAEQKRLDTTTAGAAAVVDSTLPIGPPKDAVTLPDTLLVVPGDVKKRKVTRQVYTDRAFEYQESLKKALSSAAVPTIVIDVPLPVFEELRKSNAWLSDEDAWKAVLGAFPAPQTAYANTIREAVWRKRAEGVQFVILFAIKEEQGHVLKLQP